MLSRTLASDDYGMSEQPNTQQRPPLRRSSTDKIIGGVCGGLARTLGIDPVIVRVIMAVVALLGGAGLAVYVIAWILIPTDEGTSALQDARAGRGRMRQLLLVVIVAIAAISLLDHSGLSDGIGFLIFVLILLVAWQAFGADWFTTTKVSHDSASPSSGFGIDQTPDGHTVTVHSPAGTTVIQKEPKSVLGRIVWNVLAVAIGIMLALNWTDAADISGRMMLIVALVIVGTGLIVSAFAGRARGLIALGLLIAVTAIPAGMDVNGGTGDRTWTPTTTAALPVDGYNLGIGSARLDLRQLSASLQPGDAITVLAHVNIGELIIIVPSDTATQGAVNSSINIGDITARGEQLRSGTDQTLALTYGPADALIRIDIDAQVDIGQITITESSDSSAINTTYSSQETAA